MSRQALSNTAISALNTIKALFDASQSVADHPDEVITLKRVIWCSPFGDDMVKRPEGSQNAPKTSHVSPPQAIRNLDDAAVRTLGEQDINKNVASAQDPSPDDASTGQDQVEPPSNETIEGLIKTQINRWLDENMSSLVEHTLRQRAEMRKTSSHSRSQSNPLKRD